MKKIILSLCLIPLIIVGQINSVEKGPITINFVKNESGEVVLRIKGHNQPIEVQFNDVKTGTIYEQDSSVNLSQLGFESAFLALDTAGGKPASLNPDTQSPVPPVMSNVNPPLATPY